jgi:hypothetical protein
MALVVRTPGAQRRSKIMAQTAPVSQNRSSNVSISFQFDQTDKMKTGFCFSSLM